MTREELQQLHADAAGLRERIRLVDLDLHNAWCPLPVNTPEWREAIEQLGALRGQLHDVEERIEEERQAERAAWRLLRDMARIG